MQLCGNRLPYPLPPTPPAPPTPTAARGPSASATAERGSTPRKSTALMACVSGMSTSKRAGNGNVDVDSNTSVVHDMKR